MFFYDMGGPYQMCIDSGFISSTRTYVILQFPESVNIYRKGFADVIRTHVDCHIKFIIPYHALKKGNTGDIFFCMIFRKEYRNTSPSCFWTIINMVNDLLQPFTSSDTFPVRIDKGFAFKFCFTIQCQPICKILCKPVI